MKFRLHPGQQRADESRARFVLVLAGLQSGKTSYGPHWCLHETPRVGPGDYLVATPTFPLLEAKLLPEFRRLFEFQMRLGEYVASPYRRFVFYEDGMRRLFRDRYDSRRDDPSRVLFGYAAEPESLESATCKWAWLDEAGQKKFRQGAWEAIQARLSLAQGRALITTSLYALNWLKNLVEDARHDPGIEVIHFESIANPAFPVAEFERMRRKLPRWKFNMRYRGIFERPPGLIYDCLKPEHKIPRFNIPASWKRYLGLDFGSVNMAAVFLAEEPDTKRLFCYRTYHEGGKSASGHVRALLHSNGVGAIPYTVGGSLSEDDWRADFRKAGLPVRAPKIRDVEVGIDRFYGCIQSDGFYYFDDLLELDEELSTYSRVLDEKGEPTEEIEDKSTFHLLDAGRYIVGDVRGAAGAAMKSTRIDFYPADPAGPRGQSRIAGAIGKRSDDGSRERTDAEIEAMLDGV